MAAAVLGQLALVAGSVLLVQYLSVALRASALHWGFRLAIAPLTAGIVTLSLAAGARDLPMLLIVVLVLFTAALTAGASIPMLLTPHTRAAGVVLSAIALAVFLELVARILAVRASQDALTGMFRAAQVLATVSFLLVVFALGVAAVWLSNRNWTALAIGAGVVWIASGIVAWGAIVGSGYSASAWQVLAHRGMGELARNPWPLLPTWLYFALTVAALFSVPIALFARRAQPFCRSAVALALLCRNDADVPVVALALALASVVGAVAAAKERAPKPEVPTPAPIEEPT